jgi:hypothetical protein
LLRPGRALWGTWGLLQVNALEAAMIGSAGERITSISEKEVAMTEMEPTEIRGFRAAIPGGTGGILKMEAVLNLCP